MLAYKYVVTDRVDVLENGYIRFTQVAALNDPFETYPCFQVFKESLENRSRETLERHKARFDEHAVASGHKIIPRMVKQHLDEFRDQLVNEYLMLSLTRKRNNLLMWSHYAQAHRGLVIGFDADNPFFQREEMPRIFTPLWEVKYSDKRPVVPTFAECDKDLTEMLFLTKSSHWAYEEELRMFAQPRAAAKVIEDVNRLPIYLVEFPRECIREVIFGHLMSKLLKERIAQLVQEQYGNAMLFQATLNDTDFDLDIVPYQ
jgi:hypothetical protein